MAEICLFLREIPLGRAFKTVEIATFLRGSPRTSSVTKKQINAVLYDLHDHGELVRLSVSPPVWSSKCSASIVPDMNANCIVPVRPDHRPPDVPVVGLDYDMTRAMKDRPDLAEDVLAFMSRLGPDEGIHPRILAKALGFSTKSDLNPVLYLLQKEGKVKKTSDCPPVWKMTCLAPARTPPASTLPVDSVATVAPSPIGSAVEGHVRDAELSESVASHAARAFDSLLKSRKCADHDDCGRRSVATFTLQTSSHFLVVALGSGCCDGSKGQQPDSNGLHLEDGRAAVVARRSFKRFLCTELLNLHSKAQRGDSTVLERCPENAAMFRLKAGISVHLYICSQGSPVKSDRPSQCRGSHSESQTCCSEKIAKWSVLGLQGALLSHYLAPVYTNHVTLGSPSLDEFKAYSMHWQLLADRGRRLSPLLPQAFRLSIPILHDTTRNQSSSWRALCCRCSTNWSLGDARLEVINGTSNCVGPGGESSQLCKRSVFKEFLFLCRVIGRRDLLQIGTYLQCKKAAEDYRRASELFKIHFASD